MQPLTYGCHSVADKPTITIIIITPTSKIKTNEILTIGAVTFYATFKLVHQKQVIENGEIYQLTTLRNRADITKL